MLAGELTAATLMIDEARSIAEATGSPSLVNAPMILAAWRGHEAQASELIEATAAEAASRRWTSNNYARSVLYNSLGRHDVARDAAWEAFQPDPIGYGSFLVPELAEAASRPATERCSISWSGSERTRVISSGWATGIEARARLASEGDVADGSPPVDREPPVPVCDSSRPDTPSLTGSGAATAPPRCPNPFGAPLSSCSRASAREAWCAALNASCSRPASMPANAP
jgi:hypothetical protein